MSLPPALPATDPTPVIPSAGEGAGRGAQAPRASPGRGTPEHRSTPSSGRSWRHPGRVALVLAVLAMPAPAAWPSPAAGAPGAPAPTAGPASRPASGTQAPVGPAEPAAPAASTPAAGPTSQSPGRAPATPAAPAAPTAPHSSTQTLFPRGEVVPKVTCAADARQSYQLYLPSSYDPARRWPIVYALDARGVARTPMERLRPAAEKYGFIVVSSFNSASDGAMQVNFDAVRALWTDSHARLSIDDRRIYLAGFSGTVRAACALAFLAPGTVAGVIGAAAGFPFKRPPDAKTDFLFFGTVGDKDFNYDEMIELEDKLTGLSLPHRIEEFDGVHEWMPEALATEALEWLELRAMKDGRRPRDPALLASLWGKDLAAARVLEAAGKPYFAWRRYRAMAADYAGLAGSTGSDGGAGPVDLAAATAKAAELGASPAVVAFDRERHAAAKRDRAWVSSAQRTLANVTETDDVALQRVVAALDIPRLKEMETKLAGTPEGLSAERRLRTVVTQTSWYLPRDLVQRKEYARAAFFLSIASAVVPGDPFIHYSIAAMRTRQGDRRAALAALKRAAEAGFPDPRRLERDPAFETLRDEAGYKEALEAIRKNAAGAATAPAGAPADPPAPSDGSPRH